MLAGLTDQTDMLSLSPDALTDGPSGLQRPRLNPAAASGTGRELQSAVSCPSPLLQVQPANKNLSFFYFA